MNKIINKIKESEFLTVLGIQTDYIDGLQELDRYEYYTGGANYKLYYFKFKTVKKLLKEIEEIKKLDKSNKNFFLWYDDKKLIDLLLNKKIIDNIGDVEEFIDENIEFLDNIFNQLLNKYTK